MFQKLFSYEFADAPRMAESDAYGRDPAAEAGYFGGCVNVLGQYMGVWKTVNPLADTLLADNALRAPR